MACFVHPEPWFWLGQTLRFTMAASAAAQNRRDRLQCYDANSNSHLRSSEVQTAWQCLNGRVQAIQAKWWQCYDSNDNSNDMLDPEEEQIQSDAQRLQAVWLQQFDANVLSLLGPEEILSLLREIGNTNGIGSLPVWHSRAQSSREVRRGCKSTV